MRAFISMLAVLMIASSCATRKRCQRKYFPGNDTIRVIIIKDTIIYRDTTLFIQLPGEIQVDSVMIPCPEPPDPFIPDTAYSETTLAKALAWWSYPYIKLRLIQKDTTIERRLQDAIREKIHWQSEYERIKVIIKEKKVPGIYKFAAGGWIGVFVILLIIILIRSLKI